MRKLLQKYQTGFYIFTLLFYFSVNTAYSDYSFSANGKSYKIVETKLNWTSAAQAAVTSGGYLVEITSQTEQNVIWDAIVNGAKIDKNYVSVPDGGSASFIWIGANDISEEGTWLWDGDNSGSGINFWKGQGNHGNGDGEAINGSFYNWGGKSQYSFPQEPDNYVNNQDAAAIAVEPWPRNNGVLGSGGEWNDLNVADQIYYIIEYDYSGKPAKPTKPTGLTSVCQGTASTQYETTQTLDAKTYTWTLSPIFAGDVTGTDKTVNVTWNPNFSGTAEISVMAVNPVGDGPISDKLSVTVKPRPTLNEKPSGTNQLCMNPPNSTYTITGVTEATSYNWSLTPTSSGQIVGSGKSISVNWSDTYFGDAVIKVVGVNDCGAGTNSDSLKVVISKIPDKPSTPTGKTSVYQNDVDADYTIVQVPLATTYTWDIAPKEAGTLTSNKNNVTVNWGDNFAGEAKITVKVSNSCGSSAPSDSLTVNVSTKPARAAIPSGITTFCQGTDTSSYQTEDCIGAKAYYWILIPSSAGTIKDSSKTIIVTWNKTYSGEVKIAVAGVGNLDKGDYSDSLTIQINPLPLKCEKPTGENHLCTAQKNIEYQINSVENAVSYVWNIAPSEAGQISGTTEKAIVNLSDAFLGSFNISVKAINDCGNGEISESYSVLVTGKPNKPNKPNGYVILTKGAKNVGYSTESVEGADTYSWNLTPSSAGELNASDKSCRIDWDDNFIGTASLSVKTSNNCGESDYSESLSIELKDSVVSVSNLDVKELYLSPNPARDEIRLFNLNQLLSNTVQSLSIVDVLGNTINKFDGNKLLSNDSIILSIKEMPSGVYYCIVKYSNTVKTIQFVILK